MSVFFVFLFATIFAKADEITLEQAETAVVNWIRLGRDPVGRRKTEVESSRTVVDGATGAAVHVVRLAGGGFVVTAADDTLSPIMVSAEGGDLDTDERNPLWAFLRRDAALALEPSAAPPRRAASARAAGASAEESDIAEIVAAGAGTNRAAWDELLGREPHASGTRRAAAAASSSDWVSEIKVTNPLTTTKWGQKTHNGSSLKNHGKLCYNYYTPPITPTSSANAATWGSGANPVEEPSDPEGNRPCGCTATAAAQLMRVQEHGTTSFQHAKEFPDQNVSARFEWGKMVDRPTSDKQCEAVGKLTATIAYKIGSSFGVSQTTGYASRLPALFKGTAFDKTKGFGYKSAEYFYSDSTSSSIESSTLQRAVIPNIDAGFPVIFGIRRSASEGHAIVIDGYKFSGSRFSVHANYGWYGGSPNTWYFPPDFKVTTNGRTYNYNVNDEIVYNVFKSNAGSLVAVHVVNESKKPVNGFKWSCSGGSSLTKRDSKKCTRGTAVFFAPAGTYNFTATSGELSGEAPVTVGNGSGVKNQIVQIVLRAPDVAPVSIKTGSTKRAAREAKDGSSVSIEDVQTVTLSCETEGAAIYYTLDGSEPDFGEREDAEGNVEPLNPNCRLYTGPFEIAGGTATVRAIAAKDGMANSDETETTFSFRETKSRDKFADARPLAGEFGTATFDNSGCGAETGEPRHSLKNVNPAPASVWASWTAPRDGFFTFRLSGVYADDGTDMDTQLAVYTGSSVSKLDRVASNDDAGAQTLECGDSSFDTYYSSCVSFRATKGVSYKIAMDTYYGAYYPGTLTLAWSEGATDFISPDSSDHCVSGSGEQRSVSFESSSGWVLEEYSNWLAPLAESGSDDNAFSYVATSNATGKVRSGYLLFRSGEEGWGMLSVTQGTLPWYTSKAAAVAAAKSEGKRILLVYGRDSCGNTRYTRFTACEDPAVKAWIEKGYIPWYCNCDTQWAEASIFTSGLGSFTLPMVCVLDPANMSSHINRTTGLQTADALNSRLDLTGISSVVTLDRQSGTGGSSSATATYGRAMPSITAPTRKGYIFGGYYTATGGGGTQYYTTTGASARNWDKAAATTLYAKWTAKTYAVTLNRQSGTGGAASATATYGAAMPAITLPTRTGYAFDGYFTAANGGGTQYYTAAGASARTWDIDGAATLYAYWIEARPLPVHRFYSKAYKGHFFTISETEKEDLVSHNPNWKYENVAYRAFMANVSGTTALYRFYSKGYRGHFFTIDADEAETVKTNPNWKYEGIAYYVYPQQVSGSVPVYRFWSKAYRHHFYTTSKTEKEELETHNPNWKYECIAFYALSALNAQAKAAEAMAAGTAGGARGTLAPSETVVSDAAWTLAADGGAAIAVPGMTEVGLAVLETRADAPDVDELSVAARSENAPSRSGDDDPVSDDAPLALRLALPDGAFEASLWSAKGGMVSEKAGAEGSFDFALPATGVWHWLRVRDAVDEDAFSVWLRAE